MRVIVLGAGLLGVTSAYFLQQLGHEVTVIDRQGTSGAETRFANDGQISVSHAEPWANPSAQGGDRLQGREGLRVAGTAELNGYDRHLNQVRCEAIVRRVEQLFPGAGDTSQAQFWTGLRPATPSNVPLIGKTKVANLFLNTGHGTLGWAHACGSGKALAHIVSGLAPEVDFAFTGTADHPTPGHKMAVTAPGQRATNNA